MNTVSVVIPAYNCGRYIEETIRSVQKQSYGHIEIIVVDDGSTDDTAAKIKKFGGDIKYLYQRNQGAAVARNRGLAEASGEYIAFLDADDLWDPHNLETKIHILDQETKLGGVFSDFRLIDNAGIISENGMTSLYPLFTTRKAQLRRIFERKFSVRIKNMPLFRIYAGNIFNTLLFGNFINLCSIVLRKSAQQETGYFRPELITQQDYQYWLRLAKYFDFAYVDKPLLSYRRHGAQLTAKHHNERILRTVISILEPYYKQRKNLLPSSIAANFESRFADVHKKYGLCCLGNSKNKESRQAFKTAARIGDPSVQLKALELFTYLPPMITNDFTSFLLEKRREIKKAEKN